MTRRILHGNSHHLSIVGAVLGALLLSPVHAQLAAVHVSLERDEQVEVVIDAARRLFHTRLHSAGEVICAVVRSLGLQWPVIGAIHYPGQASVSFATDMDVAERSSFRELLETSVRARIAAGGTLEIVQTRDRAVVERLCGAWPDYLRDSGEEVRIVVPFDGLGRPCMGTHVVALGDIGEVSIRKVKSTKGGISVGYDINGGEELSLRP